MVKAIHKPFLEKAYLIGVTFEEFDASLIHTVTADDDNDGDGSDGGQGNHQPDMASDEATSHSLAVDVLAAVRAGAQVARGDHVCVARLTNPSRNAQLSIAQHQSPR